MTRIIFMGSPDVAVPSLAALCAAGHEIVGVFTQPDKPKGRGQEIAAPAVKIKAEALGLPVFQPRKVRDAETVAQIAALKPDTICVVAYGKILPPEILKIPPLGCINVHFSLLPKYRGAACVAYALMHGDDESGVTTMLMDEGMDTGPILMQWSETILPEDTTETLSLRLAELGARQLVKTVEEWGKRSLDPVPQRKGGASYAPLLSKEMGKVDWNKAAVDIVNRFRALTPWPGLFTFFQGKRILLTQVRLAPGEATFPGKAEVSGEGRMWVGTGRGRVEVLSLKPEGKNILSPGEFMRGWARNEEIVFA